MPRFSSAAFSALIFLLAVPVQAQPAYAPHQQVKGTVRVWGSAQMQELMGLWAAGFRRYEPGVQFHLQMTGTVSAMGGLYGGAADLALMGREIWPEETLAYTQVVGAAPTGIAAAMGSFDVPTKADALMVFVNRDNPLNEIGFDRLAALFGCGGRCQPTWADAGVSGDWGKQPVHLYGYSPDEGAAKFFRTVVLRGAEWNCGLHAYVNRRGSGGARVDAGRQIVDALAADPLGIAIANIHYATPAVKTLALSVESGSPVIAADRPSYAAGKYPLTRRVFIYFHCGPPGAACAAAVQEFLRYVLSPQGQEDVKREGAYSPLPPAELAGEQRKLAALR